MAPAEQSNGGGTGGAGGEITRQKSAVMLRARFPKKKDGDLSEEDLALKQQLELYVQSAQDSDPVLQKLALESMSKEIRTATSSMTVLKPLNFLRPHYGTLKDHFEKMMDVELKKLLADILSFLALTMSPEGERESLKYRLLGSSDDIGSWGHGYVRNLTEEIDLEYYYRQYIIKSSVDELWKLAFKIFSFHMKHNAVAEAADLALEIDALDELLKNVDEANYRRMCLYLTSSAKYLDSLSESLVLETAYEIYMQFEEYPRALQVALGLGDSQQLVKDIFETCTEPLTRMQLCFMLSRHGVTFELDARIIEKRIIDNNKLSDGYLSLARDIEVMEPKSPEDIYTAHLLDGLVPGLGTVEPARQYLAPTFVNAFVNAGFGQDKLMTVPSESSSGGSSTNWLCKNKEHGKISAAASLGMILLWDVDSGISQLGKYFHSPDTHVIAGALLGVGIVNCNVQHEFDPALALLIDFVDKEDSSIRIGAIMGLGLAYAGSRSDSVRDVLVPILSDGKTSLDVIAFTALSLGLVFMGSWFKEIAQAIVFALMSRSEAELGEPLAGFLPLGLGLIFLQKQCQVFELGLDDLSKTSNEKIRRHCDIIVTSCAFAGTGNVLMVQNLLNVCGQHLDKGDTSQGSAVLGIAMVAMAEELGLDMAIRTLERLLQYGEQTVRRAVPLALGLLCISNPKVYVIDILGRLCHDEEPVVAMAAVISLGLIGAGTNNARIAGMLRDLSYFFCTHSALLFCVRIAQGFVSMGKGLLTLSPFHSERFLWAPNAMAGLVIFLHACLNMSATILGEYPYFLYFLALAMQPRMLMTVDEKLNPLSVPVRVGQAVDVAGQAGCPRTIRGFRTHLTPVILSAGERAELATEKYIPVSPILEGFVILKENPEYSEE